MLLLSHFTKKCTKCEKIKMITDYGLYARLKGGIRHECKICKINNDKKYLNPEKEKIRLQEYRKNNPEKVAIGREKWKKNNPNYEKPLRTKQQIKETSQRYYKNNREKISIRSKKYWKTSNGIAVRRNSSHNRRNLEKRGNVTNKEMMELQKNAKSCYWCNKPLKNVKVHIDHYNPISKGGEHTLSNLVVSCQSCNNKKHAKDPISFANSIGKLL